MSLFGYLKGFLANATPRRISEITRSYLQTALWSSTDEDGRPLDRDYSVSDFSASTMAKAEQDATKFAFDNGHLYVRIGISTVDAGRLFWHARTGSGITFMDDFKTGSVEEKIAKTLQANAKKYGEASVYAGDDGELEIFTG